MAIGDMQGYTANQAKIVNYGLYIPRYTSFNSMALDIQANTWARASNYDQNNPRTPWQNLGISASDWHRILDFDGYFHQAAQIMGTITMDSNRYAGADVPSFQTRAEGSTAGNLSPADIRLVDNGAISMENLYYGIYIHTSAGSFYKVLGRCNSLGTGAINISDGNFIFARVGGNESIVACMFLCDSNLNNGNVGTSTGLTGNFIPITPTRAHLTPYFDTPHANITCDSVNNWMPISGGDVAFVVKVMPDGGYTWTIDLYGEYTSGGVHTVLQIVEFDLFLAQYFDSSTQLQKPLYIRMQTDRAHARLTAKVYSTAESVDYYDVLYHEEFLGTPVATETTEIAAGEILTSQSAAQLMSRAAVILKYTDYDAYSETCLMGTWPQP